MILHKMTAIQDDNATLIERPGNIKLDANAFLVGKCIHASGIRRMAAEEFQVILHCQVNARHDGKGVIVRE